MDRKRDLEQNYTSTTMVLEQVLSKKQPSSEGSQMVACSVYLCSASDQRPKDSAD